MPELSDKEVLERLSNEWKSRCVSLRLFANENHGDGRVFWRSLLKDALRDLAAALQGERDQRAILDDMKEQINAFHFDKSEMVKVLSGG